MFVEQGWFVCFFDKVYLFVGQDLFVCWIKSKLENFDFRYLPFTHPPTFSIKNRNFKTLIIMNGPLCLSYVQYTICRSSVMKKTEPSLRFLYQDKKNIKHKDTNIESHKWIFCLFWLFLAISL